MKILFIFPRCTRYTRFTSVYPVYLVFPRKIKRDRARGQQWRQRAPSFARALGRPHAKNRKAPANSICSTGPTLCTSRSSPKNVNMASGVAGGWLPREKRSICVIIYCIRWLDHSARQRGSPAGAVPHPVTTWFNLWYRANPSRSRWRPHCIIMNLAEIQ